MYPPWGNILLFIGLEFPQQKIEEVMLFFSPNNPTNEELDLMHGTGSLLCT